MTWNELPQGEAIAIEPGASYAVVASVKASHSAADVQQLVESKGLTLLDYAEEGARAGLGPDPRAPGYRMVAATATATEAGELPWSVPWPLSLVDGSGIVRAWVAPAGSPPAPAPGLPAPAIPTPATPSIWPLLVGLGVAGAGGWWLTRRKRR